MPRPQILLSDLEGFHNTQNGAERVEAGKAYRDVSTVVVIPTRGQIPARVVESWWNLMAPMNQQLVRLFVTGLEVGAAYNEAVAMIRAHPILGEFKYMLTLEEDNMPPPDGLPKLLEHIDGHAAIGGLYWTKGELGQPMIYGRPGHLPMFAPQPPVPDSLQECNGLGMGFTLFDLTIFDDIDPPWFETVQDWSPETGARAGTQDLVAFEKIRKAGFKVACDTRVKVGHYETSSEIVW